MISIWRWPPVFCARACYRWAAAQKEQEAMMLEKRITPAVELGNSGGEGLLRRQ